MIKSLNRRVVITGLGVLAANGNGRDAFWESLLAGKSGIGSITLFEPNGLPCRIAGEVKGFDHTNHFRPEDKARRMGRFSQMAVVAARMAIQDAGWSLEALREWATIPVVMGVSTSAMDLIGQRPAPYTAVNGVPNAAASAIAYTLGIKAQLLTLSDGCASSLDALSFAADFIRSGRADLAICGGSESAITPYVFESFSRSKKVSMRNEEPEKASRPFDRQRDGGVIAEGAGIMIIEHLEDALARGAPLYAEVLRAATAADPLHSSEGDGLVDAMKGAISNSSLEPRDIDHISAHGPSDPEMDVTETQCIKKVFGARSHDIPITSVKGCTGNPMAAGGILQAIGAALSLQKGLIPPIANLEEPGLECDLDYVAGAPRRGDLRHVMINTHGFGRSNSSLILRSI